MLNKIILIGNLGKDPELKYTQGGAAVCSFSVACQSGFGDNKKTEWFNVQVWKKTAEACAKYLSKGDTVYVEGRIETQTWEKDGQKQSKAVIQATEIKFIKTKPKVEKVETAEDLLPPDELTELEAF